MEPEVILPVYKLAVLTSVGPSMEVHGSERELREVFDDWHTNDHIGEDRILIVGYTDNAAQSPIRHSIIREDIRSMSLLRWE